VPNISFPGVSRSLSALWRIGLLLVSFSCAGARQYSLQPKPTASAPLEFERGRATASSFAPSSSVWTTGAFYQGDRTFAVALALMNNGKKSTEFSEVQDVYAWYLQDGVQANRIELIAISGTDVLNAAHRKAKFAVAMSAVSGALNTEDDPVARQLQTMQDSARHNELVSQLRGSLDALENNLLQRTTLKPGRVVAGRVVVGAPPGVRIAPICDSKDLLIVEVVLNNESHRFEYLGAGCGDTRL
jgi:hypothetical protein